MGSDEADLGIVFMTPEHADDPQTVVEPLVEVLQNGHLLGCTAESVVGEGQEIEDGPGVSVWLARLPGVDIHPFSLSVEETPDGNSLIGFPYLEQIPALTILLADPWTTPVSTFLERANAVHPGMSIVGGMASGADEAGESLIIDRQMIRNFGASGVMLSGNIDVDVVISQGCRPIGEPYAVTAAEGNVILELGGRPPLERLQKAVSKLSPEQKASVPLGLHAGILVNESATDPSAGDFLIRNIERANTESGSIAVGDFIEVGTVVQFQIRDAAAADEDLNRRLEGRGPADGALMFTCNGRGVRMFGVPHHDVAALETAVGPTPTGGMFCAGEIGPVGGRNFIHGFTASIALLRSP